MATLTGIVADEIREAKTEQKDVPLELDTLRAKLSHPAVVAALQRAHANPQEEVR